jgi:hypothetical protein
MQASPPHEVAATVPLSVPSLPRLVERRHHPYRIERFRWQTSTTRDDYPFGQILSRSLPGVEAPHPQVERPALQRLVLTTQSREFLALSRGQSILAMAAVKIVLFDPIAYRPPADVELLSQLPRFATYTHQVDDLASKLRRVGRMWFWHDGPFLPKRKVSTQAGFLHFLLTIFCMLHTW